MYEGNYKHRHHERSPKKFTDNVLKRQMFGFYNEFSIFGFFRFSYALHIVYIISVSVVGLFANTIFWNKILPNILFLYSIKFIQPDYDAWFS